METKLIKSAHAVGESSYHIQLTPAYRQAVFGDKLLQELTIGYIAQKLSQCKAVLLGYGFGQDHLHLFLGNVRHVGEIELVRQIKGYSSYMLRKGHAALFSSKLWGDKFWSSGHFYRSVGAVTAQSMQWYVTEGQKKHWRTHTFEEYQLLKAQTRLTSFN
jgi:putative transposase